MNYFADGLHLIFGILNCRFVAENSSFARKVLQCIFLIGTGTLNPLHPMVMCHPKGTLTTFFEKKGS